MGKINKKKSSRKIITVVFILVLCFGALGYIIINGHDKDKNMDEDSNNPTITFTDSSAELKILLGEHLDNTDYKALDANGNDITSSVTVDESNLNRVGSQTVTYTVKDSNGRIGNASRTVEVLKNPNYKTNGVPICMYHYVYESGKEPDNYNAGTKGNFIEVKELEKEMSYLVENKYYFPTWQEIKDYVDGNMALPEKSIVITFDDGAYSFLDNGVPVLDKYKIPSTSFLIGSADGPSKVEKYKSKYVTFQSHSYNMHRAGGNIGHGGIMTALSKSEIIDDLKKNIEICGKNQAFAYPYGDYNDTAKEALKEIGTLCAVTTKYGKAKPGDDPLLLPRVRMTESQGLDGFIGKIN